MAHQLCSLGHAFCEARNGHGSAAGPSGRQHLTSAGRSCAQPSRSLVRRGKSLRRSTVASARRADTRLAAPFGPLTAAALFATGATLGTALDGIHTNVSLLQYDEVAIQLGSLSTSAFVPPLLGIFYVVLGALHGALSREGAEAAGGAGVATIQDEVGAAAAAFGVLALNLEVSALLFNAGAPSAVTAAVLLPLAAANWAVFEGPGRARLPGAAGDAAPPPPLFSAARLRLLGLAALCGVAAPYLELPLLSPGSFGLPFPSLWHYTRPDAWFPAGPSFPGMPAFVPLCYAFYVPAVGRLRRALGALEGSWRGGKE